MFHIPPGIDGYASAMKQQSEIKGGAPDNADTCGNSIVPMWVPEWTAKFDALLAKYHSTVIAGFAAHTHSDDYRLIGAAGLEREFVLMNPAISPIYSQNPGFRVVSYNRRWNRYRPVHLLPDEPAGRQRETEGAVEAGIHVHSEVEGGRAERSEFEPRV